MIWSEKTGSSHHVTMMDLHWQQRGSGPVYNQTKPGKWLLQQMLTHRPPGNQTPWKKKYEACISIWHCLCQENSIKIYLKIIIFLDFGVLLTATCLFLAMAKLAIAAGRPYEWQQRSSSFLYLADTAGKLRVTGILTWLSNLNNACKLI